MGTSERQFKQLLRKGTRLLKQGKASEAVPLLERAREMKEADPDALLNLSGAYIMAGRFKEAIPILEHLREQEPENPMVWTNLGAAYLGNPVLATEEQQMRAVDAFKQALALEPSAPSVAYNIGLIYRDRQEPNKAIRWFRKAVRANPQDRHARSLLRRLQEQTEG